MSRPPPRTTASGDAVSLQPSAHTTARGRAVAQREHDAMQALALVRTTLLALERVAKIADRAALLLSHNRGLVEPAVKPELKRVQEELQTAVQTAAWSGQALLCGGLSVFALEDPWRESSESLTVAQPDLQEATRALAGVDPNNALLLSQRNLALLAEIQRAQKQLRSTAARVSALLATQRSGDVKRVDDGFISMIGRVRDHVLHAGNAALRVQGAPSTRAAWLIEGCDDAS